MRNWARNTGLDILIVSLFGLRAQGAEQKAYVIKDGVAVGRIYSPREAGRATRFALKELREHLGRITGATLEESWRDRSTWNFIESQGYGSSRLVDGDFWYRLKFKAPEFPAGKKVILRIGALDDEGTLYLNGVKIADRQMGKDGQAWNISFAVDVTEAIEPGQENLLAVHGYDAEGAAGIWRPCALYTE